MGCEWDVNGIWGEEKESEYQVKAAIYFVKYANLFWNKKFFRL